VLLNERVQSLTAEQRTAEAHNFVAMVDELRQLLKHGAADGARTDEVPPHRCAPPWLAIQPAVNGVCFSTALAVL